MIKSKRSIYVVMMCLSIGLLAWETRTPLLLALVLLVIGIHPSNGLGFHIDQEPDAEVAARKQK